MIPQDTYAQPNAADPVLDSETVLGLVRLHIPPASAVTRVEESGGEARAYAIDDDLIFKTQLPHRLRPRTSLQKEVFFLNHLAEKAPELVVPRVLGYRREDSVEYILMTRVPGVAVRYVALEGEPRRAVFRQLGRMLHQIHALPLMPFEASGLFPGDGNQQDVQRRIERGVRQAAKTLSTLNLDSVSKAGTMKLLNGAALDQRRAALHSNPGQEHVFVDAATLQLRGLIDFGDAYISHPSLDLRRWTAPEDRAALLEGYGEGSGLDDAFVQSVRTVQVISLIDTIASSPERRQVAFQELNAIVDEI